MASRTYPRLRQELILMGNRFYWVRNEFQFFVPTQKEYAERLGVNTWVISWVEAHGFPPETQLLKAVGQREGRKAFEMLLYGNNGYPAPEDLLLLKGDRSWREFETYLESLKACDIVGCMRRGFPPAIGMLSALGRIEGWWVAEYIVAGKDGFPVQPSPELVASGQREEE